MSKYKALFLTESQERLSAMNQVLLQLEKEPDNPQHIAELFRAFHSIKGMAASMGYGLVADLSHGLEDLLQILRDEKKPASPQTVEMLFAGRDHLESMIRAIEKDEPLESFVETTRELLGQVKALEKAKPASAAAPKVETQGQDPFEASFARDAETAVEVWISEKSSIPAARGFLVYKALAARFKIERCLPPLEQIKRGEFDRRIEFHLEGKVPKGDISQCLAKISDVEHFDVIDQSASPKESLSQPKIKPGPAKTGVGFEDFIRPTTQVLAPIVSSSGVEGKVRVSTEFLDDLISFMGEILISGLEIQTKVRGVEGSLELNTKTRELVKNLREIYEYVLRVRMTPLGFITENLSRVVRDLARQTGKSVQLETKGTEILMDRAILEELDAPLLHLIRNSVDHGIEKPEQRRSCGKPERGSIQLRAQLDQGMVVIEVEDDGHGLDARIIKEKALEKKLVSPEQLMLLGDKDVWMLICAPGFSTNEEITTISGRGVGMDVVKSMVESYGGILDIESIIGKGTIFTLRLPVTVSIVKVLLFEVARQTLALPISRIDRTLEISTERIRKQQGRNVFVYDDTLIPLVDMEQILHFDSVEKGNLKQNLPVVLVDHRGRRVGFRVDSFVGQQEVVLKPLSKSLKQMKLISGATILANGHPTFILDVNQLMQMI